MSWRHFERIAPFNPAPLLHALRERPDLWHADTYMRDYPQGPVDDMRSILLRFPAKTARQLQEEFARSGETDALHECVDYPGRAALPEAERIIDEVLRRADATRLGRIVINYLRVGGRIFPHADNALVCARFRRFHAVIQTSPGAVMRCGSEWVNMPVGEIWGFDNAVEHEVLNEGDCARIHLIVDVARASA